MDEIPGTPTGPITPIKINEINGLMTYLSTINWSEPWFIGLGLFHVTCVVLTICTRKAGALQSLYFGVLLLLVFCAEQINQLASEHWALFAKEQYFDSNGLFISIVFSTPLLINCLVIVVYWLWDVGVLISDVKRLKIKKSQVKAESAQDTRENTEENEDIPEDERDDEEEEVDDTEGT